jgi:dipeptidyl aminopeptidase/acylaminoacyl peptidase
MSRSEGGTADLWIANADGSGARMVYDSGREDSAPAWSPDSRKLAFEIHGPIGGVDGDIFVLDLRTGLVRQLTSDPQEAPVHDEGPAWSPDGTMLSFTSERSDPNGDIWIMRADGSGPTQLTDTDTDPDPRELLHESPDWQALPFLADLPRWRSRVCGDLSLAPGGAASIAAVNVGCGVARVVAARWTPTSDKILGYRCSSTPHSFDQEVVECRARCRHAGVAFVWRRPAT